MKEEKTDVLAVVTQRWDPDGNGGEWMKKGLRKSPTGTSRTVLRSRPRGGSLFPVLVLGDQVACILRTEQLYRRVEMAINRVGALHPKSLNPVGALLSVRTAYDVWSSHYFGGYPYVSKSETWW